MCCVDYFVAIVPSWIFPSKDHKRKAKGCQKDKSTKSFCYPFAIVCCCPFAILLPSVLGFRLWHKGYFECLLFFVFCTHTAITSLTLFLTFSLGKKTLCYDKVLKNWPGPLTNRIKSLTFPNIEWRLWAPTELQGVHNKENP